MDNAEREIERLRGEILKREEAVIKSQDEIENLRIAVISREKALVNASHSLKHRHDNTATKEARASIAISKVIILIADTLDTNETLPNEHLVKTIKDIYGILKDARQNRKLDKVVKENETA